MTSEGNSALLPANVDRRPPLQRGLMNFQLSNKSLKDLSLGGQLILFLLNLKVSLGSALGNIEIFLETKLTVFNHVFYRRTVFASKGRNMSFGIHAFYHFLPI